MAAQQHTLPPIQQLEGQSHHSSSLPSQQYAHGPISSSNGGPVQPPPHHPAASQSQPQPPPQSHTQPPPPPTQHQQQHHPLPSHHPYTSYTDLNTPQSSFSSNGVLNGFSPPRYSHSAQNMDARQMSGGRHKKEIKRRTKTGCLTCRKRRIKVCAPKTRHTCASIHKACANARIVWPSFFDILQVCAVLTAICSATRDIRHVEIVQRANATVWAMTPSSKRKALPQRYSRHQARHQP